MSTAVAVALLLYMLLSVPWLAHIMTFEREHPLLPRTGPYFFAATEISLGALAVLAESWWGSCLFAGYLVANFIFYNGLLKKRQAEGNS